MASIRKRVELKRSVTQGINELYSVISIKDRLSLKRRVLIDLNQLIPNSVKNTSKSNKEDVSISNLNSIDKLEDKDMTNPVARTSKVATVDMSTVQAKLAKLNKKAAKLGMPEVKIEVLKTYMATLANSDQKIEMNEIEITGNEIVISDHKFIGTLDRATMEGSVLVKSAPRETIPTEYHDAGQTCDHCNYSRFRKNTFILQDTKNGKYLQIGSTCVKDFLGYSPDSILSYRSLLEEVYNELDKDEESYGSGYLVNTYMVMDALAITDVVVGLYGFVGSKADEELIPTKRTVDAILHPSGRDEEGTKYAKEMRDKVTAKNRDFAKDAIAWVMDQDTTGNEYLTNLKTIIKQNECPVTTLGYLCSLIPTYNKHLKRNIEFKNEHFGEVKKRETFTFKCINIMVTENQYGFTHIHKMMDEEGRQAIFFSSAGIKIDEGETATVKATVKSHGEYKGVKQTVVQRVTVV